MALGDLFNDGHVDAVVNTNDGDAHVIRNETKNGNHWVGLTLIGHMSNRDGIGAEVKLVSGGKTQWATVSTAGSYLSASDKRLHFGLGTATQVDAVEIHWPSGFTQTVKNVGVDRFTTINEPGTQTEVVGPR
jgi:hypothetical protein